MSKENRHTEENHIFRYKQFTITQNHAAMRVGTDSDLLGTLSAGGNNILDIGFALCRPYQIGTHCISGLYKRGERYNAHL